jgi:hypothetical protein
MKRVLILAAITFVTISFVNAQSLAPLSKRQHYVDLSAGFGSSQAGIVAGYFHNWHFGKKNRLFIGTGVRFNSYFGSDINFLSAPSDLASEESKTDTLAVPKSNIFATNVLINLGYSFNSRLQAGFNIDLIGFSLGSEKTASFIANGSTTPAKAKPTGFNLLLVGNNDIGTLNSEFYLRYRISPKIGIKAAYQYFFAELKTDTKVQTIPEKNDRFRNKASLFNVGISYFFN